METVDGYDSLTICIPAYNEAAAIGDTLRALRQTLPQAKIIVVDDGSQDGTFEAASAVEGVTVIRRSRNCGYGASIKTAMRHAKTPFVAWYDADGQHRPEDLIKVAAPVLAGQKDAVIGARTSGSDAPLDRGPGRLLLRFVAQAVARERIPDQNSGMRCFRRDVIMRYLHLLPDGFSASTTTTLLMIKRGYRLGYEDIVTLGRVGSKSTVRHLRDGMRTIHVVLRIMVLFEAFRVFTIASLLQLGPGLIYGIYIALRRGLGFPTAASTVVVSGVLTFLIGLVCDQITALRQERFEGD